MNKTDIYSEDVLDDIFQYIKCTAIFILEREYYFVFASKDYFELDIESSFKYYLEKNIITEKQFEEYKKYRNGIWRLTKDNFQDFLRAEDIILLNYDELKTLLFTGFDLSEVKRLYEIVEQKLAHNLSIDEMGQNSDFRKIHQISSRLPLFYINFDTNVYFHMDWDRTHEDYSYENWFSRAFDFGYLVPDKFSFWKVEGMDLWKFREI